MAQHFLEGRLSAFVEHTERAIQECKSDILKLPLYINLAAAQYGEKYGILFNVYVLVGVSHLL